MSYYDKNTSEFTEIGIAVGKYTYGKKAKITIPALLPLVPADKAYKETDENDDDNLLNRDPTELDLDKGTDTNYVELLIPRYLRYDVEEAGESTSYKGKKGDKFLVTFVGGNINNPIVYRRYHDDDSSINTNSNTKK